MVTSSSREIRFLFASGSIPGVRAARELMSSKDFIWLSFLSGKIACNGARCRRSPSSGVEKEKGAAVVFLQPKNVGISVGLKCTSNFLPEMRSF